MSQKNPHIRVRFPPSPTGPMTLGNARTAFFNWMFAKKMGGTLVLRIEDTDRDRSKIEYEKDLIEALHWLGITYDEGPRWYEKDNNTPIVESIGEYGPYRQSERLGIYKKYLEQLLKEKKAYYCYCTPEELELHKKNQIEAGKPQIYSGRCRNREETPAGKTAQVIRFIVPQKQCVFKDSVRGVLTFDTELIGDIVIAKNLESPLYNFAVVIDDELMKISHVIRGEDHISNTPKQIAIQEALGFKTPIYAHLPLVLSSDRKKLSKRTTETSIFSYRDNGYLPDAILNFLGLLGWHPQTDQEVFTPRELAQIFDIERVQKAGAIFNAEKLDWLNREHIAKLSTEELVRRLIPFAESVKYNAEISIIEKIVPLIKEKLTTLSDFKKEAGLFFSIGEYEPSLLVWKKDSKENTQKSLNEILEILNSQQENQFQKNQLAQALEPLYDRYQKGSVLWPLRVALSGLSGSPDPLDIASVLGKTETLKRLKVAIEKITIQ